MNASMVEKIDRQNRAGAHSTDGNAAAAVRNIVQREHVTRLRGGRLIRWPSLKRIISPFPAISCLPTTRASVLSRWLAPPKCSQSRDRNSPRNRAKCSAIAGGVSRGGSSRMMKVASTFARSGLTSSRQVLSSRSSGFARGITRRRPKGKSQGVQLE